MRRGGFYIPEGWPHPPCPQGDADKFSKSIKDITHVKGSLCNPPPPPQGLKLDLLKCQQTEKPGRFPCTNTVGTFAVPSPGAEATRERAGISGLGHHVKYSI